MRRSSYPWCCAGFIKSVPAITMIFNRSRKRNLKMFLFRELLISEADTPATVEVAWKNRSIGAGGVFYVTGTLIPVRVAFPLLQRETIEDHCKATLLYSLG